MDKPHSIQFKIIGTTLISTLIITCFIVSICFCSFQNLLSDSIVNSTKFNLQHMMYSFSSRMEPIIAFSNWCHNKTAILNYLTSADSTQTPSTTLPVWKQLQEEYLTNPSSQYISRIVLSDLNGRYLQMSSVASFNAFNITETISSFPFFEEVYHNPSVNWIGFINDPFSDIKETQTIPIIRGIYSSDNQTQIGWSYLSISPTLITQSLSPYDLPNDSQLFLTIQDKTYLVEESGFTQIISNRPIVESVTYPNYIITQLKNDFNQEQTYITVPSSIEGWYLTQSFSHQEFATQKRLYIFLMLLICLVVFSIGIALAIYLNHVINQPLRQITHKMACISKGDFSYEPSIEWPNELGVIGKGINELSKNVSELMETRIKTEKEKKELEYQILQSQINPHFLYNTLNSIKWMATIQHATGIGEMTTALSRLMHAVSKDTKQIVTLKDEIELLDNYFLIQKYRYGGTLTLNYNIQDSRLYACQILKFTLQPIVENAIFHGIEPKGIPGIITITASRPNPNLFLLEVKDNGIGMTPEQIQHILSDNPPKSEFFKKIGICNVHQRIQYTFGPSYGLSFSSQLGEYTCIQISLPYIPNNLIVKGAEAYDKTFNC